MKKIKVAICGFGLVGQRRFKYITQSKKFEVVGICDKLIKKKYIKNNIVYCETINSLLKLKPQAIFICVTNNVAAKYTIMSLKRGIHVFCEKPPSISVKQLLNIKKYISNINLKNLKLKYGFNHRYHYSVIEALKLKKSNHLGKVINMTGTYGKSSFEQWKGQGNWRVKRKISGGGILLDQGIHLVDLIRLFGGEFDEVKSFISNSYWKKEIEDNAFSILRSQKNIIAMIHSSATQWEHLFELKITFQKGFIYLKGILSGSKSYGKEKLIIGKKDKNKIKSKSLTFIKDDSWKMEIEEFANSILKNKKIINGTFLDALNTMQLVEKIYNSDMYWKNLKR